MIGSHCIKSWSITQVVMALSSAEAELYALLRAATQTLGLMAVAADMGQNARGAVHVDASATLGILNRQGLGKLRHIGVQYLWMQSKVKDGEMTVQKVPGVDNPADLCTKHLPAHTIEHLMTKVNAYGTSDRATSAPRLGAISAKSYEHGHDNSPEQVEDE